MTLIDIAEQMKQKQNHLEESKMNSNHVIGIYLCNYVSKYYDKFKDGLIRYIEQGSFKIKCHEIAKDSRIVLCLVDEMSIKYSDCISELNSTIGINQVVIFININRYPDRVIVNSEESIDLFQDRDLKFNYRVVNCFISDDCIQSLIEYLERKEPLRPVLGKTRYDQILRVLQEWTVLIVETNKEFLNMPRMISERELEEHISISLGSLNDRISTVVEKMFQTHRQNTEELIESVISRVLKEKFESISEKLQKKYEAGSSSPVIVIDSDPGPSYEEIVKPINDEMEIVSDLEYIMGIIEKHKLNIYPTLPSLTHQTISNKDFDVDKHKFTIEDIAKIKEMVFVMRYVDTHIDVSAYRFFIDINSKFGEIITKECEYYYDQKTINSLNNKNITTMGKLFRLNKSGKEDNISSFNHLKWWKTFKRFIELSGFKFIK